MTTERFLRRIPKTDLHVHLDGSLRLETLSELAREQGVSLPSYSPEGLRETVFKERYADLVDYLQGFHYTTAVMQNPEALERTAYEFACDNYDEGVRYFEVRFAPQLHASERMGVPDVIQAVNRGLARAKAEWNARPEILSGSEPPYEYAMILSAMRMFTSEFSQYFRDVVRVHRHAPRREVFGLASLELARAAVAARDRDGIPVTGFDLAGQEAGYPAEDHVAAYDYAHRHFLKKTVHAGEAYGPESIFQAITDLHADRIGHGYYLLATDMIKSPQIEDRAGYVQALAQYIADRRVTIEVCLTSNLQTNPELGDLSRHAFHEMFAQRLSATFCTDNRTVSHTSVTRELGLAMEHFGLRPKDLKNSVIYGFKRSFFPGSYIEKRAYVRGIIDYYERVEREEELG